MQRESGVSFVFSSHDPKVHAVADDTVTLRDGSIESVTRAATQMRTDVGHPQTAGGRS